MNSYIFEITLHLCRGRDALQHIVQRRVSCVGHIQVAIATEIRSVAGRPIAAVAFPSNGPL